MLLIQSAFLINMMINGTVRLIIRIEMYNKKQISLILTHLAGTHQIENGLPNIQ